MAIRKGLTTTAALMATRLLGAGAGFLAQLMLARALPPSQVGVFFVATSFAAVLGLLATQGYPALVQRFSTRYGGSPLFWPVFFRHVQMRGLVAAALVTLLLVSYAAFFPGLAAETRQIAMATAALMPASFMFSLYPPFANAQSRFALALIPELMLRPLGLLCIAALVFVFGLHWSAADVVVGFAIISTALAAAQYLLLAPSLPKQRPAGRPRLKRMWAGEAAPALAATLFILLFGDIVVLAAAPWLAPADTAAFTIAVKLAMLAAFFVQVAHQVSLPEISAAMKAGDAARLRVAVHQATLLPAIVMFAGLVGATVLGAQFLNLYGADYARAAPGLVLLLAAMLVRAVMGPASAMLVLAGAQKSNAAACTASIAVLLVSNAVLVPLFGLEGGCAAVMVCISFWTATTAVLLKRNCGVRADLLFAFAGNTQAAAKPLPAN
jgi:O-antigen/teichoic acid export membrane protein